jgi:hypothetical protein
MKSFYSFFQGRLNVWFHWHVGAGFTVSLVDLYVCFWLPFVNVSVGSQKNEFPVVD